SEYRWYYLDRHTFAYRWLEYRSAPVDSPHGRRAGRRKRRKYRRVQAEAVQRQNRSSLQSESHVDRNVDSRDSLHRQQPRADLAHRMGRRNPRVPESHDSAIDLDTFANPAERIQVGAPRHSSLLGSRLSVTRALRKRGFRFPDEDQLDSGQPASCS